MAVREGSARPAATATPAGARRVARQGTPRLAAWASRPGAVVALRAMSFVSRLLLLAGAAGMALSLVLPWVTIKGIGLELGPIGAEVSPGARTVAGSDTSTWPFVLAIAALVAILALLKLARRVLLVLGLVVVAGGGALLYYVSNAVELETDDRGPIAQLIANAVITSSTGPGTPLLLASGLAIVVGALLAR
ncbi:MAG: hypothetical protein QOE31_1955 [Solirubrobacteraceae bacterium]|nr:hypothetical protein [Solirubrobacteraceae bacterium]